MKNILIIGGLIVVVLIAVWLWLIPKEDTAVLEQEEAVTELQTYQNEEYGYSFLVPDGKDVLAYTQENISVGDPIIGGFKAVAEINVVLSGEEGGYQNYSEFLFEITKNMCAADGPSETIYCNQLVDLKEYTNEHGVEGVVFYQQRIHEDFTTNISTESLYGPFYAFNIEDENIESDFAALIVRPPAAYNEEELDENLVSDIANSLRRF